MKIAPSLPERPRFSAGTRVFGLIWLGQLVSLSGSGMSQFALGVWVYQETGSATQFALVMVFMTLPLVLLWPAAGVLADRLDKRKVMLASDAGAGASTAAVLLLLVFGRLEVWHVYVAVGISSAFGALQWPAYSAAIPVLIPKQHLGRANGLVELAGAVSRIVSPLLGGVLFSTFGLHTVVLADLTTFLFALGTLLSVRIPHLPRRAPEQGGARRMLREAAYGWRFIRSRTGLFVLLLFFIATNFTMAVGLVLVQPLVLGFASAAVLGAVLSVGGAGMVVGGLVMSVWGGPRPHRLVEGILLPTLWQGFCLILAGLRPSASLVAASAFLYLFSSPICIGCNQTLWQRKVPGDVLGRVIALRRAATGLSYPAAYIFAGPLAEYVFEPLLLPGGLLASSVGPLVGIGPGRGTGFLIMVAGLFTAVLTLMFYLHPRLRRLEAELPDAL